MEVYVTVTSLHTPSRIAYIPPFMSIATLNNRHNRPPNSPTSCIRTVASGHNANTNTDM